MPARNGTKHPDLDEVAVLYANVVEGSVPAEEACHTYVVLRIQELLRNKTYYLKCSSRTAALWFQYMDMADILNKFPRAECTRNWAQSLRQFQKCFLS